MKLLPTLATLISAACLPAIVHAQSMSGGCASGQPCSASSLSVAPQGATYTVGSGGNFATITAAMATLNQQVIPCCAYVNLVLLDGRINEPGPVLLSTTFGNQISITGQHVYSHSLTSVQSSSGSAGAWTYVLNLDSVTNIAVGDYEAIYGATGGVNPSYLAGVWPVTAVDAVNNRITVTTTNHQTAVASGSVAATAKTLKAIVTFSGSDGFDVWGQDTGNLSNFHVLGNGAAGQNGISLQDRNRVYVSGILTVSGFGGNNILGLYNSEMNADGQIISSSSGGPGITVNDSAIINAPVIVSSGNASHGVYSQNGGVVESGTLFTVSGNGQDGARGSGGHVIADGAMYATGNVGNGVLANAGGSVVTTTLSALNNAAAGATSGNLGVLSIGTLTSTGNGSSDQLALNSPNGFVTTSGCLAIGYTACQPDTVTIGGNGLFLGASLKLYNTAAGQTAVRIYGSTQAETIYGDSSNSAKWECGHKGSGNGYDFACYNASLGRDAYRIYLSDDRVVFDGIVKPGSVVVGGANSCSTAGAHAWVTDAIMAFSSSTRGGQITGSGSNAVPGVCDGSHWLYD